MPGGIPNLARTSAAGALAFAALFVSAPARAADEEIQVYMDEIGKPGEPGLDVHVNYVTTGDGTLDYVGSESPLHRWRITPEFSLPLSDTIELGAYLPLATIAADGKLRAEGAKARIKYVAPHSTEGFFWGANLEVGRVSHALDVNPWNGEFKLIGGVHRGRLTAAVNANFDFAIDGPAKGPAELEIASKVAYAVTPGFSLGLESYNGVGPLRSLGHFGSSDQATYLVADTHVGRFDLNLGVGKGYGTSVDATVVKVIVGVPIS